MKYLRKNPELLEDLIRMAVAADCYTASAFVTLKNKSTAGALCKLLLEQGYETPNGLIVSRKLTNIEIAKFLSVHKVTVACILRVLKEEDVVERTPQGLLLKDLAKLQQYANDEIKLKY